MTPKDVVAFWGQSGPAKWFAKSDSFDAEIRTRFEATHHAAARGELSAWAETSEGALALLLLLDQFPRNLWRGSGHAFATDPLARSIAAQAVDRGLDKNVEVALRAFFYLPFEHSEAPADQDRSVALFEALALEDGAPADYLPYAVVHRDIIARFGRFPHRNACLGRTTTEQEQAFLDEGGFAG